MAQCLEEKCKGVTKGVTEWTTSKLGVRKRGIRGIVLLVYLSHDAVFRAQHSRPEPRKRRACKDHATDAFSDAIFGESYSYGFEDG